MKRGNFDSRYLVSVRYLLVSQHRDCGWRVHLGRSMVRNLVISVGVIAASVLTPSLSVGQAPPPQVVASGVGEARVTPDRATIMVGVQSRAATAAAAAADNARRQKAILDTLRALGLGGDQLSTANYNVAPEMVYPQTADRRRESPDTRLRTRSAPSSPAR